MLTPIISLLSHKWRLNGVMFCKKIVEPALYPNVNKSTAERPYTRRLTTLLPGPYLQLPAVGEQLVKSAVSLPDPDGGVQRLQLALHLLYVACSAGGGPGIA